MPSAAPPAQPAISARDDAQAARRTVAQAGRRSPDRAFRLGAAVDGAARGAVGAMAMTGMRVLTTELGLVLSGTGGHRRSNWVVAR